MYPLDLGDCPKCGVPYSQSLGGICYTCEFLPRSIEEETGHIQLNLDLGGEE